MDASLQSKINDLSTNGYQFELSKYISIAWENFKKAPGQYIGYLMLLAVIAAVLSQLPLGSLLTPLFSIGFALFANKIQRGEQADFAHFFDGFKSNPGHLLLVSLVSGLIILGVMIPFMVVGGFSLFSVIEAGANMPNWSDVNVGLLASLGFLMLIPVVYLAISWSWAYYFVAFKNLDFWPAMEASRKIISKQWFSFFTFGLVLMLIIIAGALCFGLGLLVAIPVVTIAPFIAFEQIIGLNDDHEIDIIDHLIDDEA